jgi:hypothetical protein
MKKTNLRLRLDRETVRPLAAGSLRGAAGGSYATDYSCPPPTSDVCSIGCSGLGGPPPPSATGNRNHKAE